MAVKTTRKSTARTAPAKTVDGYIAAAPADKRAALKKLRATIKTAAPTATEALSYGLVGYKHNGKPVIYFGYAKGHVGLYGGFDKSLPELKGYVMSKGTIRFPADKPMPDRLVTKIVKARIAGIEKSG